MAKDGELAALTRDAGTVLQMGFPGTEAPAWVLRALEARELGGVVLFSRNLAGRDRLAALGARLRAADPEVLIAIDEEGGDVTRLEIAEGSSYPGNLALGRADDVALTEAVARSIGLDLAAVGVNFDYAPCADVNANPDNPVIGVRSFGADSALVSRHTAAYVRGLQSVGVVATAKHFPGHGDTADDSHLGLPLIEFDEATEALHLAPFRAAIAAGVKSIMTSHILFPRYDARWPATMSPAILSGLLREQLGFDGVIVTDGIDMAAISATHGVAEGTVRAVAAGCDALDWGGSPADEDTYLYLRNALVWAVREGRLPAERLHEAAERNRAVARWSAQARAQAAADGTTQDRAVGLEAARRALSVRTRPASTGNRNGDGNGDGNGHTAGNGESAAIPLIGPAHVVEFSPIVSIAVDTATPWGLAEPLRALLPGTSVSRVEAPTSAIETVGLLAAPVVDQDADIDVEPQLKAAIGRPLVLAVRDLHRNPWMIRALDAIRAERPDAVVVEFGLPHGERADVCTYGGARVCGLAAAELLAGVGHPGATDPGNRGSNGPKSESEH